MRKAILPVAIVVAVGVGFAVVNATAKDKPKGPGHGTIHVIEHATSDAVTNGSPTTDLAGNILTFANDVFDSANANKVGSDQGSCVRIVVGKSWECTWTTFLPAGQITVEGPFYDSSDSTLIAVPPKLVTGCSCSGRRCCRPAPARVPGQDAASSHAAQRTRRPGRPSERGRGTRPRPRRRRPRRSRHRPTACSG